MINSST